MAAKNQSKFAEGPNNNVGEDISKTWSLNDAYRFAPERPDGDPWNILLDPLLEKEKIQCDGWKDEVGNLLIFAGLFSAVVTAFIIDSYKTLRPDSNDDIVALLSQISSLLNNTNFAGIATAQLSSTQLPSESFSPTHSAVRINAFWFLSLIFSLAAVLVGIVCLQWLRQHQAFPGQSPKDTMAMYRMRSEGMQKWHVWRILMALPLLLQTALVLFFAGIVDFLHALGNKAVLGSAAGAIGVTLLFLVATTTLPAIQTLLLPLRLLMSRRLKPPSQCPYKSPQASVVSAVVDLLLRVPGYFVRKLGPDIEKDKAVRGHLSKLWRTRTWIDFDLVWLKVRDACAQAIYEEKFGALPAQDQGTGNEGGGSMIRVTLPLFDAMDVFRNFTRKDFDQNMTVSAAYHCLSELSNAFTIANVSPGRDLKAELDVIRQRNRYFRYSYDEQFETLEFTGGTKSGLAWEVVRLLHDQNLCIFLNHVGGYNGIDPTNEILVHRQELKVRIQQYMFGSQASLSSTVGPYPAYLELRHDQNLWRNFPGQEQVFLHQYIHTVYRLFDYTSRLGTFISPTDLHARPEIMGFLEENSHAISHINTQLVRTQAPGHTQASEALRRLLDAITSGLERRGRDAGEGSIIAEELIHLLYCAAVFICGCSIPSDRVSPPGEAFRKLNMLIESYVKKGSGSNAATARDDENREIERRFRERFPGDDVVSRRLWDLLGCQGDGQSYIPFAISRGLSMPVPQHYGQPRHG